MPWCHRAKPDAGSHDPYFHRVLNVMTDYSFNPSQNTVTPLWKFTTGGVTYSFDATTLTAIFNPTADEWDISGLGDALITGAALIIPKLREAGARWFLVHIQRLISVRRKIPLCWTIPFPMAE